VRPDGWLRLDARMLAVAPAHEAVRFVPLLVAAALAGGRRHGQWWLAGALALMLGLGALRWLTTRYRVTAERMELRSGLLFRQHRSVPRDRIRTVDVTARLLHRLFGLGVLRIGTGRNEPGNDTELMLDAVSAIEAERLRAVLLDRSAAAGTVVEERTAAPAAGPPAADGVELARLSWAWLRFAPLTVLAVASVGALLGGAWQLLDQAGVRIEDLGTARAVLDWLRGRPVAAAVLSVAGVLLVAGVLGALARYAEVWWDYRLRRQPGGTLLVTRGLLTRRSVSLEERRLRGVEVEEPLLLRAGRGARLKALATGTGGGDRSALLPPAPSAEVHRVAAAVLAAGASPAALALRRHPWAALRRRLTRAVVPAALGCLGVAVAAGAGVLPAWATVPAAAVLLPSAAWLGVDRYRNLGHLLTATHLVIRSGSLVRRTVVLRRSGIIGWRVSRSVLQRAAGLATATAITAAGAGRYDVLDCDPATAAELATTVSPDAAAQQS
jgi:putative membrane protein